MPRAVFTSGRLWAIAPDATLRHADPAATSWHTSAPLPAPVVTIEARPDRMTLVASCRDGSLHLFHAQSAQLLLSAPEPLHDVPLCLLPMPAENALFVGLRDGAVVRLHLESLAFDCMLGCGVEHSDAVNALDADDIYLYSGGEDGVVLVWDLKEATCVREISMTSAPIRSLLRVDVALWVGEADGVVEVFDIFGDDSNGIERIAHNAAHAGPVTELVKVGESEVWSVARVPEEEEYVRRDAPSVAVWDTREMVFSVAETGDLGEVVCATVVERAPFERVTVLALTEALSPHFISKQVKGSIGSGREDTVGYNAFVEDLEEQLVRASEELHMLKAPPGDQGIRQDSEEGAQDGGAAIGTDEEGSSTGQELHAVSPKSAPVAKHVYKDDTWTPPDRFARMHQNNNYDRSPESAGGESFMLSRSVSETLLVSLRRISELLVTLLTDEVLSPSEGHTRGSNDDLRAAVATITQELNFGRQLIESCTGTTGSEASVETVDENVFVRNIGPGELPENIHGQLLRKRLDKEIAAAMRLRKDLRVVMRERDILAEDLQQVKVQSESTMSSLEGIIRDNTSKTTSSEKIINELRKECKCLQLRGDNQVRVMAEVEERSEERWNELENVKKLSKAASKAYEEKLATAYDKIETMSIETLSQKDTIRGMDKHVDSLKHALQTSDAKREALEDNIVEYTERLEVQTKEHALALTARQKRHEEELEQLRADHVSALDSTKRKQEEELSTRDDLLAESEQERRASENELECVRKVCDEQKNQLAAVSEEASKVNDKLAKALENEASQYRKKVESLEQDNASLRDQLDTLHVVARNDKETLPDALAAVVAEKDAEIEHLEDMVTQSEAESSRTSTVSNAKSTDSAHLHATISQLERELEHRKRANELQEEEMQRWSSAASNFEHATIQLQADLEVAEIEIADLNGKVEDLRAGLRQRKAERTSKESEQTARDSDTTGEVTAICDSGIADRALLQSAYGEIDQLSAQLEAMHRVHREQNRELNELRTALSWRAIRKADESIRKSLRQAGLTDDEVTETGAGNLNSEEDFPADDDSFVIEREPLFMRSNGADAGLVNVALQEVQEGMVATQDKLRQLSNTARKYKQSAQCHLDMLPILYELEGELLRISQDNPDRTSRLTPARGIVQSVIAEYFSTSEKKAVLDDVDDELYAPSSRRHQALRETVARMKKLRIGSGENQALVDNLQHTYSGSSTPALRQGRGEATTTPARLLTF